MLTRTPASPPLLHQAVRRAAVMPLIHRRAGFFLSFSRFQTRVASCNMRRGIPVRTRDGAERPSSLTHPCLSAPSPAPYTGIIGPAVRGHIQGRPTASNIDIRSGRPIGPALDEAEAKRDGVSGI